MGGHDGRRGFGIQNCLACAHPSGRGARLIPMRGFSFRFFDLTNRWKNRPTIHPAPRGWPPLSFQRKLALIVGMPSVVAMVGGALALGRVASSYHRAHVLEQANASSSYLIQAAADAGQGTRLHRRRALRRQRGNHPARAILDLRTRGDGLLDTALNEAQTSLRRQRGAHRRPRQAAGSPPHPRPQARGGRRSAPARADRPAGVGAGLVRHADPAHRGRAGLRLHAFPGAEPLRTRHPVQRLHQGQRLRGQRVRRTRTRAHRPLHCHWASRSRSSAWTNSNAGAASWRKTSRPSPGCAPTRPCLPPCCGASARWRRPSWATTKGCAPRSTRLPPTASRTRFPPTNGSPPRPGASTASSP